MRRTKIVCTIGPASEDKSILPELFKAGMNVARLNFSHGNHQEHKKRIDTIKEIEKELSNPIGIMLDTQGPEIRTGDLETGEVELTSGEEFTLVTDKIKGNSKQVSVTYKNLPQELEEGSIILLDDGLIELEVKEVYKDSVCCKILNGGILGSHKGINIPDVKSNIPALTDKDKSDIKFGIKNGIHFVAASFIRTAADVIEIRKLLKNEWAKDIKIIAKIENQEAVSNIDDIINVADGIMIARGDLGVEIAAEKVPIVQKEIINKCNKLAKPVITATQMLDSMIRNPRPTRAEASDVANAIYDGTDAIMLSGESAIGKYPVESVKTMARIAEETEKSDSYKSIFANRSAHDSETVTEAISFASCKTAEDLDAQAIITATGSGYTARMVSKNRSLTPIIATTPNDAVRHTLTLSWGIYPLLVCNSGSTDQMMENATKAALDSGLLENGDLVTITAGIPVGISGSTNLIKVDVVGKPLVEGQGIGKGIVTGKVKFAYTADEAIEKVEKGDILITRMTNKQYEPAIKKASSLITAEGSLTSHPAITGLNLGIPVIVNTGKIFDILDEGELVTVDGVRGLIYRGRANIK